MISVQFITGFLKTGLAKLSTHSTTWQFKTIKLIQRPIKSLYLTLGSKLMVPRSIPTNPNKNISSVIGPREVSNRCHFSLEVIKLSEVTAKECLVQAYTTIFELLCFVNYLKIGSKTLLFLRSNKRQDFARNGQQTEWTLYTNYHYPICKNSAYGLMPLEPAETRHRSNFPECRVAFPTYNQLS